MPRGIPNAKRDDTGLKYTSFHVPLQPNPKHVGSSYLKSESQTIWSRPRQQQQPVATQTPPSAAPKRGEQVLVIHPGSRFLRIGRASDFKPVSTLNVVARKVSAPSPHVDPLRRIIDSTFDENVEAMSAALVDRMRFYKYRTVSRAQAKQTCLSFNQKASPEIIPEHNDPYRVSWIQTTDANILVGDEVLKLPDPDKMGYVVRWPIYGSDFNTKQYSSTQVILSDIQAVIEHSLKDPSLNIQREDYPLYSVILVIPDLYSRSYIKYMVNLLLLTLGFKQICVQQESLAATYGAGMSTSLVVDIGATTTSISCVDEGLVIADTRISLNVGGDDISECLGCLLNQIELPVGPLGATGDGSSYTNEAVVGWRWDVLESLKAGICTLNEAGVALNLHPFVIRRPNAPAEKYQMKAYDEIILAPMCLFEPRMLDFENKRKGLIPTTNAFVSDEILERYWADQVTQAMVISTQHLLPPKDTNDAANGETNSNTLEVPSESKPIEANLGAAGDATPAIYKNGVKGPSAETPMDVGVDSGENEPNNSDTTTPAEPSASSAIVQAPPPPLAPAAPSIDVYFEASKLPLDVAIFNSARASGGDDKIKKYLQAVLVVGGTALMPGLQHALESRLQAIATPLVQNMEKVQIIPPPREIDPRVVVWKGAAVLGRLEGVSELWIGRYEWVSL